MMIYAVLAKHMPTKEPTKHGACLLPLLLELAQ